MNTIRVTTSAELIAALNVGGNIQVAGSIPLKGSYAIKVDRTRIMAATGELARIVFAHDVTNGSGFVVAAKNCSVNGIELTSISPTQTVAFTIARGGDGFELSDSTISNVRMAVFGSGAPGVPPVFGTRILRCRIENFSYSGIYLDWNYYATRIEDNVITGMGSNSTGNCIWHGNGAYRSVIQNNRCTKTGRMGIEVWIAEGTQILGNLVEDVGSFGISSFNNVHGVVSRNNVKRTKGIGIEIVGPGPTVPSHQVVCDNYIEDVSVTDGWAVGLSMDKILGGRIQNNRIVKVTSQGTNPPFGAQIYQAAEVEFSHNHLEKAGVRYILANGSVRSVILNNTLNCRGEGAGIEAIYLFSGSARASGNTAFADATTNVAFVNNSCVAFYEANTPDPSSSFIQKGNNLVIKGV